MPATKYVEFLIADENIVAFFPEVYRHDEFAEIVALAFDAVEVLSAGFAGAIHDNVIKPFGTSVSLGVSANKDLRVNSSKLFAVVVNSNLIMSTSEKFLDKVFNQKAFLPEQTLDEYNDTYFRVGKSLLFYEY